MDKIAFIAELRAIQKAMNASIDNVMEKVMAMDDKQPVSVLPTAAVPPQNDIQYVDVKYLAKRFGVGKSTIEDWVRQGKFPRGELLFNSRVRRWNLGEVEKWMASRRKEETHDGRKKHGRKPRYAQAAMAAAVA